MVLAVGALPLAGVFGAGPAAAASSGRHALAETRPGWATGSADAGAVATGAAQTARVYLAGADPAGMTAYAASVSQPGNADYQHFLTPSQSAARFGATAAQKAAVTSWLSGAGLRVTAVTAHYVQVTGSTATMQTAFATTLHRYRTANGTQQAPASAISVPAAVASDVLTVSGLSTSPARATSDVISDVSVNVGACSQYYGQHQATTLPKAYGSTLSYAMCGYDPAQLRSAYGVNLSPLTGRGATVAVVDDSLPPTLEQDLDTFSAAHGLPQLRPGQFTENLPADIGTSCPAQPAYTEQALDVEAVHTMAPGADIVYVGTDCTALTDTLDAETRIVDGHLADIVSDSWHLGVEQQLPPDLITAFDQVMKQGAIEGIGFYFSSGDHGDWSAVTPNQQPAVQYPGSDPWVTSVGGTSLAVDQHGRYEWESGWGTDLAPLSADGTSWSTLPGSFNSGAGGGTSALFAQPKYQRGVVPHTLSTPAGTTSAMRVMPDIAALADPTTGMLIGLTATLPTTGTTQYVEGVAGGTSVATPLIAGIQADAQQAEGGAPLGFANPAIYLRYRTPAYHDVTDTPLGPGVPLALAYEPRSLTTGATRDLADTLAHDTSLSATRGYDDVTGVGSPTALYLYTYLR